MRVSSSLRGVERLRFIRSGGIHQKPCTYVPMSPDAWYNSQVLGCEKSATMLPGGWKPERVNRVPGSQNVLDTSCYCLHPMHSTGLTELGLKSDNPRKWTLGPDWTPWGTQECLSSLSSSCLPPAYSILFLCAIIFRTGVHTPTQAC